MLNLFSIADNNIKLLEETCNDNLKSLPDENQLELMLKTGFYSQIATFKEKIRAKRRYF